MGNYTKNTNFTAKDALTPGDINKKVKGSELDAEFDEIASKFTEKADLAAPTFTGNARAVTQTAGTSDTTIATTAFVATSFAPLADAALTGTPTAPTAATEDDSTTIATTAYVKQEIDAIPAVDYASETTAGTVRIYVDGSGDLQIYTQD